MAPAFVEPVVQKSMQAVPVSSKPKELSSAAQRGRDIFLNGVQPGCGVCHALEDAGVQGAVGPNLDQLHPSLANVKQAVSQGVGIMPAFGSQLNSQEIDALSAYVFEAAR